MLRDSAPRVWRMRENLYRIRYSRCRVCGASFYPVRASCIRCSSKDLETKVSSGVGTLVEYTVLYQVPARQQDSAPMIIGVVRLDEGFDMYGVIVDVDARNLKKGMRVEAVLRRLRVDGSSGLITYGIKFRPLIGVAHGEGSG